MRVLGWLVVFTGALWTAACVAITTFFLGIGVMASSVLPSDTGIGAGFSYWSLIAGAGITLPGLVLLAVGWLLLRNNPAPDAWDNLQDSWRH